MVTCNHVLSEMHPNSLRFLIKRVVECATLRQKDPPLFVFEGWGFGAFGPLLSVFQRSGYRLLHHGAMASIDGNASSPVTIMSFKGANERIDGKITFKKNMHFLLKYKLALKHMLKSNVLKIPLEEYFLYNMNFQSDNPLSNKFRDFNINDIRYSLSDILDFYNSIDKSVPKFSRDEEFARYINIATL